MSTTCFSRPRRHRAADWVRLALALPDGFSPQTKSPPADRRRGGVSFCSVLHESARLVHLSRTLQRDKTWGRRPQWRFRGRIDGDDGHSRSAPAGRWPLLWLSPVAVQQIEGKPPTQKQWASASGLTTVGEGGTPKSCSLARSSGSAVSGARPGEGRWRDGHTRTGSARHGTRTRSVKHSSSPPAGPGRVRARAGRWRRSAELATWSRSRRAKSIRMGATPTTAMTRIATQGIAQQPECFEVMEKVTDEEYDPDSSVSRG